MKHTMMARDPAAGKMKMIHIYIIKAEISNDEVFFFAVGDAKHRTGFLCGKKSGRRKKRRKTSYLPEDEADASDEIITYEEVALYYPR